MTCRVSLVLLFLLAVPVAAEGGNWTTPATLSSPNDQEHNPRVALNAAGTAIAVWMGAPPGQAAQTLEAAIRPAGGHFGSARVLVGEVTGMSKVALAANVKRS